MRSVRVAACATTLSLFTAIAATGSANAATAGVGTSQVSTSVLNVSVGTNGDVLGLRVLGDDGRATTDQLVSASPEAFSRLTALSLSSGLAEPLNSVVPSPPLESRTLGSGTSCGEDTAIDLTTAGVPVEAATGSITPAQVCSAVDADGARSNLDTTLANLSAVGGLVSADSLRSTMGAVSGTTTSEATRSVTVDAVSVLDLGALLQGLGLSLSDLPVGSVSDLLSTLNGTIPGVEADDTLDDVVVAINDAIDQLQDAGSIDPTLAAALDELLAPVGIDAPTQGTTIDDAIDGLQGALADVLENGLTALENLSLLRVDGAQVGVSTKAVDTVEGSAAGFTASVGNIHVGGLTIPGVDLTTAAATINETMAAVNGTLQEALGQVSPDLEGVVEIVLFDPKATDVASSGGYTRARAGITVLSASITPPANLGDIVGGIDDQLGIDEAITGAGGELPELDDAMSTLEGTLNQGVPVLGGGASVKLVEVLSASDFAPAGASTGDELPRTGIESGTLALFAGLLALLAIGVRRTVQMAAVRSKR